MNKTLFIAFEGIDGSGKSTQSKLLFQNMVQHNFNTYLTAQPTNGMIGKMIRDIFAKKAQACHETIAALFVADRIEHILNKDDGLLKMKNNGYNIITDRYYFSSYAYHGVYMDMDWVIEANALAAKMLKPDITVFIDISPELSMERINKNRSNTEIYETLDNLKKVREKYFESFDKLKQTENVFVTNGNLLPEEIAKNIWQEIKTYL